MSIRLLSLMHIVVMTLSNILVQYPFTLCGFHTTWGAFSYPIIFMITDLTTRVLGQDIARRVIFFSMLPSLVTSYGLACLFNPDANSLLGIQEMPLRIAFACFCAYSIGQLLDIHLFSRIRQNASWWLAPAFSTTIGNLIDTLVFFSLAFYQSNNPFLNEHWIEIASVDLTVKMLFTLIAIVPIYGILLSPLQSFAHRGQRECLP